VILKQDFRSQVLTQLQQKRSYPAKECHLDFYFFLPTEALAHNFGERLMKGCPVDIIADIRPSPTGSDWLCQATTPLILDTEPLDELRSHINRLVHEFHADFDGWEVTQ